MMKYVNQFNAVNQIEQITTKSENEIAINQGNTTFDSVVLTQKNSATTNQINETQKLKSNVINSTKDQSKFILKNFISKIKKQLKIKIAKHLISSMKGEFIKMKYHDEII